MKILITGFDPFGGETINPATEAVRLLKAPEGVELKKLLNIPTVFGVGQEICRRLEEERPDAVICVGQAGGRSGVTVERIAINMRDATISDNRGVCPTDQPVEPGGKAAYFSTLPIKKMVSAMEKAGVPARVSNTAGTFVCNDLLYTLLSHIEKQGLPIKAGFIHVPFLPAQVENRQELPSMELSQMATALEAALASLTGL